MPQGQDQVQFTEYVVVTAEPRLNRNKDKQYQQLSLRDSQGYICNSVNNWHRPVQVGQQMLGFIRSETVPGQYGKPDKTYLNWEPAENAAPLPGAAMPSTSYVPPGKSELESILATPNLLLDPLVLIASNIAPAILKDVTAENLQTQLQLVKIAAEFIRDIAQGEEGIKG